MLSLTEPAAPTPCPSAFNLAAHVLARGEAMHDRIALQMIGLAGAERWSHARLAAAGFDPGTADGKVGPNTIAAVRAFQRSVGAVPDGYASLDVLEKLR